MIHNYKKEINSVLCSFNEKRDMVNNVTTDEISDRRDRQREIMQYIILRITGNYM